MVVYCTCLHLAIHGCRPVQHQTFDLQKLIWLVTTDHSEAKATPALLQLRVDEGSFQFCWVSREERLPSCRIPETQLLPTSPSTCSTFNIPVGKDET